MAPAVIANAQDNASNQNKKKIKLTKYQMQLKQS
jgi:hypothetical protein